MGKLIDGKWEIDPQFTKTESGEFKRQDSVYRSSVGSDLLAEKDRFHLYVSYACPWAHRTLIMKNLKGLDPLIDISIVHPDMMDHGWSFDSYKDGVVGDKLFASKHLSEIYVKDDPSVSTRVTVPILFDKKENKIINNESSEIIRQFNGFSQINPTDYYPENLRTEIDSWNERIYHNINNGVYRSGFARSQSAYEDAVLPMFKLLDEIDAHLDGKSFLIGESLTEADIRLYPTLIRFDLVYFTHFKCNLKMIKDYKHIQRYMEGLYKLEAFSSTTNFDHIKRHYYYSHESINPNRIVPVGPLNNFK
ncbi:MAG: glutathione S-transferase family protein [Bdellovibrionales bacterium]